jgi:hypothetical protein
MRSQPCAAARRRRTGNRSQEETGRFSAAGRPRRAVRNQQHGSIMRTDPPDAPPLIDDLQFLEELDRLEDGGERPIAPVVHPRPVFDDAFDALESGLPLTSDAPEITPRRHHQRPPTIDRHEAAAVQPLPAEARVSFMTAALVIVVCLTAGAAGAALVFHDQVAQITESRSATR